MFFTVFTKAGYWLSSRARLIQKVQFLRDVIPCRLVNSYRCFDRTQCLHLQGHAVSANLSTIAVHISIFHFFNTFFLFSTSLLITPRPSFLSLPFNFPDHNFVRIFHVINARYVPHPSGHHWQKKIPLHRKAVHSMHCHIAIISLIFQLNAHIPLNICVVWQWVPKHVADI